MAQAFVQVGVHAEFHKWLTERAKARGKSRAAELNEIRQLVQLVEGEQPTNSAPTQPASNSQNQQPTVRRARIVPSQVVRND